MRKSIYIIPRFKFYLINQELVLFGVSRFIEDNRFTTGTALGKAQKSSFLNGRAIMASPPPLGLMAVGFFFIIKLPETDVDNFFSTPNFWTKIALFVGKYCYNPVKIPTNKL